MSPFEFDFIFHRIRERFIEFWDSRVSWHQRLFSSVRLSMSRTHRQIFPCCTLTGNCRSSRPTEWHILDGRNNSAPVRVGLWTRAHWVCISDSAELNQEMTFLRIFVARGGVNRRESQRDKDRERDRGYDDRRGRDNRRGTCNFALYWAQGFDV